MKVFTELTRWSLAGAAAAAAVVAPLMLWASPSASAAEPACLSAGTGGEIKVFEDPSAGNVSSGTRSYMWVANGPTSCQRVSSVYVNSADGRQGAEFGWMLGYSQINGVTYSNPKLFYVTYINGSKGPRANLSTSVAEGAYSTFQMSDQNKNTYWGPFLNGTELVPDGLDLNFAAGTSEVAMERSDLHENGYANWNDLREYRGGWSAWDKPQCFDFDDNWDCVRVAVDHYKTQ